MGWKTIPIFSKRPDSCNRAKIYKRNYRICHTLGIRRAKDELICVIDTDCILQEGALSMAVKHFQNDEVATVGGRLLVTNEDCSVLERVQYCEYMKTFEFSRKIFANLNAQCLISRAFGVFRKNVLLEMNGYDTDTVGEDMELVLHLQEQGLSVIKETDCL